MRKTLLAVTALALVFGGCRKHETAQPAQPTASAKTETQATRSPLTPATATDSAVGSTMPAYKAELLDGKPFDIAAERGNVVFLNLWATWCGPCRQEIPELQKLHNEYAEQGFKVVGVSLDESGKETVQQFVTENSMTYPIALDPEGKLANVFQTTGIPTSVLIDRSGKIVWKKYGLITIDDELMSALKKALAEKKA
jgi:cytochrome c biogenesis protein CcmG, thiol:disulfide interchange protein DsbE